MKKKYKKQTRVAMAVALAATSVSNFTSNIFAQEELEISEYEVLNNEEVSHIEKATRDVEINATNFPDNVFRDYVSSKLDSDKDGILSSDELNNVTNITLDLDSDTRKKITSFVGIEHFPNLKQLECHSSQITSLDISKNTALQTLNCSNTQITSLDVSNNTALRILNCENTQITSIDVSNNTALQTLSCSNMQITSLDISKNTALQYLLCGNTQITSIDVSKNTALQTLNCINTQITSIDVSNNTVLKELFCYNTQITSLDVSNNTVLRNLNCNNTQITSLDVSKNTTLQWLNCDNTNLAWLYIGDNPNLNLISKFDSTIALGEIGITFNMQEKFPGIDPNRITSISGATLDKTTGIVSGYNNEEPIHYTYDCGTVQGNQEILNVTLNFTKLKEKSNIIIHDDLNKVYDGQAVASPKITQIGSQSTPVYEWYVKNEGIAKADSWTRLSEAPVEIGNYKLVVRVAEDMDYYGATAEVEFSIKEVQQETTPEDSNDEGSNVSTGNQVEGVETGDRTQVGLWTILLGICSGLMMFFAKEKRKEER